MSRSFLALIHFDGTEFLGWQRQATGRTVQGEVERVLARLANRHVAAHGAGRTDAGVHALGLAVSFAMPESWTPDALRRALNALLPRDIWVAALSEMRAGFHARKHAEGRRYRYDIGCDDGASSPFRRKYEWALGRAPRKRMGTGLLEVFGEQCEACAGRGIVTHEEPVEHRRANTVAAEHYVPRTEAAQPAARTERKSRRRGRGGQGPESAPSTPAAVHPEPTEAERHAKAEATRAALANIAAAAHAAHLHDGEAAAASLRWRRKRSRPPPGRTDA